jgi:hypothetical protein
VSGEAGPFIPASVGAGFRMRPFGYSAVPLLRLAASTPLRVRILLQ